MNVVHLMGNLTRDPELRVLDSGARVVNFGLAVNERYKRKSDGEPVQETLFQDCEAWDTGADLINEHFSKGDPIIVHGKLRSDTWEKDGEKRSKTKLRVEKFEFIPSKRAAPAAGETGKTTAKAKTKPAADAGGDESIPF